MWRLQLPFQDKLARLLHSLKTLCVDKLISHGMGYKIQTLYCINILASFYSQLFHFAQIWLSIPSLCVFPSDQMQLWMQLFLTYLCLSLCSRVLVTKTDSEEWFRQVRAAVAVCLETTTSTFQTSFWNKITTLISKFRLYSKNYRYFFLMWPKDSFSYSLCHSNVHSSLHGGAEPYVWRNICASKKQTIKSE